MVVLSNSNNRINNNNYRNELKQYYTRIDLTYLMPNTVWHNLSKPVILFLLIN